jgi:hypothetical protein
VVDVIVEIVILEELVVKSVAFGGVGVVLGGGRVWE